MTLLVVRHRTSGRAFDSTATGHCAPGGRRRHERRIRPEAVRVVGAEPAHMLSLRDWRTHLCKRNVVSSDQSLSHREAEPTDFHITELSECC